VQTIGRYLVVKCGCCTAIAEFADGGLPAVVEVSVGRDQGAATLDPRVNSGCLLKLVDSGLCLVLTPLRSIRSGRRDRGDACWRASTVDFPQELVNG